MTIQRIEPSRWAGFLGTVSETLIGKRAEVDVLSVDLGDQRVAEWLPLLGISHDPKDDLLAVHLTGVEHMIQRPRELYADFAVGGLVSLEIIDGEGRRRIVTLRDPVALPPPGRA